MLFPKVYPILDASVLPPARRVEFLLQIGAKLVQAGVTLLEYRNKSSDDAELIADAQALRSVLPQGRVKLILDDRVDLVETVGFDGVHVDAGDLTPAEARRLLGPERIIGTYGGGEGLLTDILLAPVDYLSIGPVFETRTKQTTKAPIGLDGIRRLRAAAGPEAVLVAVAGITLATAAAALDAGASVVAVSEAIFRQADPAAEFRRWVAELG
jgi:thiamine-phosphate pyrophosphorylase